MKKNLVMSAALAASLFSGIAAAQTVWRYSNWLPPTHPVSSQVTLPWAKAVEAATQGRVRVEVIAPLGAPQGHLDLVRNGVADVTNITTSYTASRFVLTGGLELPFLSDQNSAMSVAAQRTYERFFAKANEFDGVKFGGLALVGPYQIYTTNKQVNSLDDLKGQKIREAGGITKAVVELLGATPFFAPAPQTFDVLSKGVGDGELFPPESIPGFKVTSTVKHGLHVPGGFNQNVQALIINEAKFRALSPADQAAVDKVIGEYWARAWGELWDKTNAAAIDDMRKAGVDVKVASPALMNEIRGRLARLEGDWIAAAAKKNVDGKAALEFMRAEVRRLEKK
ncbi:MAG: TRAP transporter substrate-binding protein [Burkholderiales bacterium]|nr:TRAP transporter substrate-binding protein [Burkholderiales bacterium]